MRGVWSRALVGLLAVLLLAMPLAHAQANRASYGPIEFYTDKASYLPGETVKFTIVVKNRPDYRGQIDIYISRNGNIEYIFHYPDDNGTVITFHLQTVGNDSVITFEKVFTETGVYEAKLSAPQLNVPASATTIRFSVAPNYQIAGKVVDETGKPVAGATVVVKTTPDRQSIASTTTNSDGTFIVSVPQPGTYIVCAKAPRFLKNMTMVTVTDIGVTDAGTIVIESIDHAVATIREDLRNLGEQLSNLSTTVNDMYNEYLNAMQQVQNILSQLSARIDNLEQGLTALNNDLNALGNRLANLEAAVNTLSSDFDAFKQQTQQAIADISGRLDDVSAKVNELDQRVSTIEQSYATKDEVQKLREQLNQLNQQLGSLASKVDNLEQATINQLSNQLNDLTNKLGELSNDISSASRTAMIAVALAIVGIIIAIVAVVSVYRRIA